MRVSLPFMMQGRCTVYDVPHRWARTSLLVSTNNVPTDADCVRSGELHDRTGRRAARTELCVQLRSARLSSCESCEFTPSHCWRNF
jgi:hypothetical protein